MIVLDDGFQHRRIGRNLDLVMLDAAEPFGFGRLLPRGLLREPIASLRRADVIALSRANMVDADRRAEIRQQAAEHNPNALWIEVSHAPQRWITSSHQEIPLTELQGKTVLAFCGVGNPSGFHHSLHECGVEIRETREFPDHHRYTREDIEQLQRWSQQSSGIAAVVCTHKDLVKIGVDHIGPVPLFALSVGIEFLTGEDAFCARLDDAFESH